MKDVYNELNSIVNRFFNKYKDLSDDITSKRLANDKWTLKEIIGHLIDSASNNHQRFVRLQISDELLFPDYSKDNSKWIQIAKYNELDFCDIMLLWKQYNILIGNIIRGVDEDRLENYWKLGRDKITLRDLMKDYVAHVKDHLKHFEMILKEGRSG